MKRVAVFVDAGYFWVQAVHVVHGKRDRRDKISITYQALRQGLLDQVKTQFSNAELLRVYWYDGPDSSGKNGSHLAIEQLDDFKLRLGTRNGAGAQKAVDGLIIADMISLAQTKAISDALLMTGDADLTPGVMAAQNLGIRVHLLSMGPTSSTSPFLKAEVDRKTHWDDVEIRKFATEKNPIPNAQTQVIPVPPIAELNIEAPFESVSPKKVESLHHIAQTIFTELDAESRGLVNKKGKLSPDIDKILLAHGRKKLGRQLDEDEKRNLRTSLRRLAHPE